MELSEPFPPISPLPLPLPFDLEPFALPQPPSAPPGFTFSDSDSDEERLEDRGRFQDDLEEMWRACGFGSTKKGDLALKNFLRNACRKIRQEKAELEKLGADSSVIRARMQELRGEFATAAKVIAANASAFDAERAKTEGAYKTVSAHIEGARPDFTAFTKKKVVKHPSKASSSELIAKPISKPSEPINETTPKISDAMAAKKTAFARCVRLSMDPESIVGTKPCLEHYSKGLTAAQKKELSDFESDAMLGKAINDVAMVPAVVAKVVNTTVGGIVKGLVVSSLPEACYYAQQGAYLRDLAENKGKSAGKQWEHLNNAPTVETALHALSGKNPQFNAAVKDLAPSWVKQAGKTMIQWDHQLDQFDKRMQERYRTIPGIVHNGIYGTAEIAAAAATGPILKAGSAVVKRTSCLVNTTFKSAQSSFQTVSGASKAFEMFESSHSNVLRASLGDSMQPVPIYVAQKVSPLMNHEAGYIGESVTKTRSQLQAFIKDEAGSVQLPQKKKVFNLYDSAQEKSQETIHAIVEMATGSGKKAAFTMDVERVMNSELIPYYGHVTSPVKNAPLRKFVDSVFPQSLKIVDSRHFDPLNEIFNIRTAQDFQVAVIREFSLTRSPFKGFVPDIVTNDLLRNKLKITQMHIQDIIACARYHSICGSERGAVMFPAMPVRLVSRMFANHLEEMPTVASALGRAGGEIHSISTGGKVRMGDVELLISSLETSYRQASSLLRGTGLSLRFSENNLRILASDLRAKPGIGGLLLGNAQLKNFMYEPGKLTLSETSQIARSISNAGPHGLQGFERFQFVTDLVVGGEKYGHSAEQINTAIAEFHKGYNQFYKLPAAPEVERFSEVYWLFERLNRLLKMNPQSESVKKTVKKIDKFVWTMGKPVAEETSPPKSFALTAALKTGSERYCGKGECTGAFVHDMTEFAAAPSLINKELKRDLLVVQFHGPGVAGVDRTHNWWLTAFQTNRLLTLDEVMDKAGLLSTWGERTHVTVARIPKGEQLTALIGKSRSQIDAATGEARPGGAIQIRVKDFKPEWIVETRRISGTD